MEISGTFGDVMRLYRQRQRLSQQALATKLGIHRNTITHWEQGDYLPKTRTTVRELAQALHLSDQETASLLQAASLPTQEPPPSEARVGWALPYLRNPFFTGREILLQTVRDQLTGDNVFPQLRVIALSGLGGIGKTQAALEYAYRFAEHYSAVLWLQAETQDHLLTSFATITSVLGVQVHGERDPQAAVAAIHSWLARHPNWLLLVDNVQDPSQVKPFLPTTGHGAMLLTTRLQTCGSLAQILLLEPLSREEGIELVLKRSRRVATREPRTARQQAEHIAVANIVDEMEGLPLALDQAGAYIEETGCSIVEYAQLFHSVALELLDVRDVHADYPLSVVRTFLVSFEYLQQLDPAAADLLRACAFLAATRIPEALLKEGLALLGAHLQALLHHPLAYHAALKTLLASSLVRHDALNRSLTMHHLVQVVLRAQMTEDEQRGWAERVIRVLAQAFPAQRLTREQWSWCESLVPHALSCVAWSTRWSELAPGMLPLLEKTASYLMEQERYQEAERLLAHALKLQEHLLGGEHPQSVTWMTRLGTALFHQERFKEAEDCYLQAARLLEQEAGTASVDLALVWRGQAQLQEERGQYVEAEQLYQRALALQERVLGSEHVALAETLARLGQSCEKLGKYVDSEAFYERSVRLREQFLGLEHPAVAASLRGLAFVKQQQGADEQVEFLYRHAIGIQELTLGAQHPAVALTLNNLGTFLAIQGNYDEAERCLRQTLHILEHGLGKEALKTEVALTNLGKLLRLQGKLEQAEACFLQALRVREQVHGPNHPQLTYALFGLAEIYRARGDLESAYAYGRRVMQIQEQSLGEDHPNLAYPLTLLADVYWAQGKREQAEACFLRAWHLTEQVQKGPLIDPEKLNPLEGLAALYREQGRDVEAGAVYRQVLSLREPRLTAHLTTADCLEQFAAFLKECGHLQEAEVLYQRALGIREQVQGADHQQTCKAREYLRTVQHVLGEPKGSGVPENTPL